MQSVAKVRTLPRASLLETWATDAVPPHVRHAYWSGAIGEASGGALQLDGGADGPAPAGALTRLRLPDIHLARVRGAGQRLACRVDSGYPVLVVVDAGHDWRVLADGAEQPVRAGQVAILDVAAGAVLDFRSGLDAALLAGSAAWARRWAPAGEAPAPVRLCDAGRGWGKILATTLRELAEQPEAAAGESGAMVGDLVGFALAASRRTEPAPRFSGDLVDEARRLCRERLADAALRAATVAEGLGVSVRTLVRAFEGAGTTFAESLREMRLQHAAALLSQPELAHMGVAEVGRQCGYPSSSHFVREFGRRFGITPGQARARSAASQAGSESLLHINEMLAQARVRIEAQRARVTHMTATHAMHLPAALDLLRNLQESLTALERMRETSEHAAQGGGSRGPGRAR